MSDIVKREHFREGWTGGLPETPCGYGSRLDVTKAQRQWIPELIDKYAIKTIADIGAGDLNWIKHTDLRGAEYRAFDLVPRHPDVQKFDILLEIPPKVDMLICLWVLNHLEDAHKALENLKASGSRYLLFTKREKQKVDLPHIESMLWGNTKLLRKKNDWLKLAVLNG